MNIAVCIKQVPDTETKIKIDGSGTFIDEAGVNFVVWGLLHGVMLVIRRVWRQIRPLPEGVAPPVWSQFGSWLLTFAAVNLAWAFFCMDVHTAVYFFRRLLIG